MVKAGAIADGTALASCGFDQPSGMPSGLAPPSAPRQKHLMAAIAVAVKRGMIHHCLDRHPAAILLIMEGDHRMAEFGSAGRAVMNKLAVNGIARGHQRHRVRRCVAGKPQPAAGPEEHHMDGRAQLGEKHRGAHPFAQHEVEGEAWSAIDRLVAISGDGIEVGDLDSGGGQPEAPVAVGQNVIDHPGRIVGPRGGKAAIPDAAVAPAARVVVRGQFHQPAAHFEPQPRGAAAERV